MNCISSRSIQACAQLRNVCSRSHILPARPFTRFSLARVCDLRASSRRAPSCASCHTSATRNIFKHSNAPQFSQRSSRKRNMGSNAIVAPEKATTADNNPLLEVSWLPRRSLRVISRGAVQASVSSQEHHKSLLCGHVWCRTQSLHNSTRSRQSMSCLVSSRCLQS